MKLRNISGLEIIKRLKKVGFIATRQQGSHVRLEKY
jgi:predicted RNA binding protein YcfA (HicA-like mRNA interferase family)